MLVFVLHFHIVTLLYALHCQYKQGKIPLLYVISTHNKGNKLSMLYTVITDGNFIIPFLRSSNILVGKGLGRAKRQILQLRVENL